MKNEHVVESKQVGNYTVEVLIDYDPFESPRDWDNLGTIKSFSRHMIEETDKKYVTFGSWEIPSHLPKDIRENLKNYDYYGTGEYELDLTDVSQFELWIELTGAICLPIYAYIHGGMTISTNTDVLICRWDSGQVGYYWVSKQDALKEFGRKKMSKKLEKKIKEILKQEIKNYDDYLVGNVYGYRVLDQDGEVVDSCWGFVGDSKYCLEEGISIAEWHNKQDKERADQMQMRMTVAIAHGELTV